MSQVSQTLRDKAAELRGEAATLNSSISWDMTKQAALNSLVEGGVAESEATEILNTLEDQALPNKADILEKIASLTDQSEVFEKVAAYIDEIESKLCISNAKVEELEKVASETPALKQLKDRGFNNEEMDALKSLPGELLEKVATNIDNAPWGLGQVASDRPSASVDPMLNFLTN